MLRKTTSTLKLVGRLLARVIWRAWLAWDFIAIWFVVAPLACFIAAAVLPIARLVIAIFYEEVHNPTGGCAFERTDYVVERRAGVYRVCVCPWCSRHAFEIPGKGLPKSTSCPREHFGAGDVVKGAITIASLGLAKDASSCGSCSKIRDGLNDKMKFRTRLWVRWALIKIGLAKAPPPPWLDPLYAKVGFIRRPQ